jgi:hypothetical protein
MRAAKRAHVGTYALVELDAPNVGSGASNTVPETALVTRPSTDYRHYFGFSWLAVTGAVDLQASVAVLGWCPCLPIGKALERRRLTRSACMSW